MAFVANFRALVDTTRSRLTLKSVETYFFLMAAFATLGMFFRILATAGPNYDPNLDLQDIFALLSQFCVALVVGFVIFFCAMLSIYFDDVFRLDDNAIYSSNFIFTRIFTPAIRFLILYVALIFLGKSRLMF